jgi:hypothetical protein
MRKVAFLFTADLSRAHDPGFDDGYSARVWTGMARKNYFRGQRKERTFETAFLEYGAMQNLVRSTGRSVWYLDDLVEDNPGHDWTDYRSNWESTLTASLLQSDVWRYEVAPWPERVFGGRYPRAARRGIAKGFHRNTPSNCKW